MLGEILFECNNFSIVVILGKDSVNILLSRGVVDIV